MLIVLLDKYIIDDNQTIRFAVNSLYKSNLETRIAFPSVLINKEYNKSFPDSTLNQALTKEKAYIKEKNTKNLISSITVTIATAIYIFTLLNVIIYPIYISRSYSKSLKPNFQGDYYREPPAKYSPAVVSYLMKPRPIGTQNLMDFMLDIFRSSYVGIRDVKYGAQTILATILDLSKRGFIEISNVKNDNANLKLLDKDTTELCRHEKFFINSLIFQNAKETTLDEIEKLSQNMQSLFSVNYYIWLELVSYEAIDLGLIDNSKKKITILDILLFIFFIISLSSLNLLFPLIMTFILASSFVPKLLQKFSRRKKFSKKGVEDYAKWKAFKKFLQHFSSIENYEMSSLVLWDDYLPYATALGVAKNVIDNLNLKFTDVEDNTSKNLYRQQRDNLIYNQDLIANKLIGLLKNSNFVRDKKFGNKESKIISEIFNNGNNTININDLLNDPNCTVTEQREPSGKIKTTITYKTTNTKKL
jgi:uncharacterized membrane protein